MTASEAIEWLKGIEKKYIHGGDEFFDNARKVAISTAISALEKQMPKKPIKQIWVDDEKHKGDVRLATKDDVLTKDNHGIINLCPNCEERVMRYKYLRPPNDKDYYCKHCGQALDWSDTE